MSEWSCRLEFESGERSGRGDFYDIRFRCVAIDRAAAAGIHERAGTCVVRVRVKLAESLRVSPGWSQLDDSALTLHLFAFVQDQIERHGLPGGPEADLMLSEATEAGRFSGGSPYSLEGVQPGRPFVARHPLSRA